MVKDINSGEAFTRENIKVLRPGYGLHPRHYEKLIGQPARKSFKKGDRLT